MSYEDGGTSIVSNTKTQPHYHGDETRALFVMAAILLIVGKSTGAIIPLSTTAAVIAAVVLVIAAGITNPANPKIHWLDELLAIGGTLLFGVNAIDNYRQGISILDGSFICVELLALLSLLALYFTTRTIRGLEQQPKLI